ncbi:MAG: PAS domain S-box protein [Polyangia bacterium]
MRDAAMLRQLNRELWAIRKCNQAMVRADNEQQLLDTICAIICQDAGYALVWVGYAEHDAAKSVRPVAWSGISKTYVDEARVSWAADSERGRGPGGRSIRDGQTAYCQDLSTDPALSPWRTRASECGLRSIIGLPLADESGGVLGTLLIYSQQAHAFTPAEIDLLETLAADLAFGIGALRTRAAHAQADAKLFAAQEVFRSLVESSPDIIARYDRACRRTYTNQTYLKVAKLPEQELIGSAPAQYSPLPPASSQVLQDLLQRVLASGTAEAVDVPWRKADGRDYWYNIYAFPELDRDGKVASVMTISRDFTERKAAEAALAEKEKCYRTIFQNSPLGIFRSSLQGRFIELNPALAKMLGYDSPEAVMRETHAIFDVEGMAQDPAKLAKLAKLADSAAERQVPLLHRWRRKNGQDFLANLYLTAGHDAEGKPVFWEGIVEDVTETRRLEAELNQAQKMEAVGRLAGGIAHDFNNMLGVILGNTELALDDPDISPSLLDTLGEVRAAAERSAALTRQLLAFARKQTVAPRLLDLNLTIGGMISMLRRAIGEDIELLWSPAATPAMVEIDPSQVDQILINLCVNARDAIAGVGRITIATRATALDAAAAAEHPDVAPGDYVQLTVSDNGCGMDQATTAMVFEPFFTTKGPGQGTGLGLATVYGVVKQNQGFIEVQSEPGQGSTFAIHLPRKAEKTRPTDSGSRLPVPRGHETILLVEDEPAILSMVDQLLTHLGYRVLTASLPSQAIAIAQAHPGPIHLLVTDVVMPEMNGRELAKRLAGLVPGLRCLFMSGYANEVIADRSPLEANISFLAKPFSESELAARVYEALRSPARSPEA